ncbi:maestro heat-like repeat-containing protein family member 6 [Neopsephotus bourkii]|uniref:maestro heat-like repeat-containing protein family member 6 n=1 Tax=Neopsephotus bourkii TaxID=309878 RepID=UPI002AA506E3|nr:maestro heat-like repeat-containing protein family member 6 [Neopsephotus bourkii]
MAASCKKRGSGAVGKAVHPCHRSLRCRNEVACLTQAEKLLALTPSIVACLDSTGDSDDTALALRVLENILPLLEENALGPTAHAIAPKLRLHFDSESDTVRQLSICLFQFVMGFVTGAEEKKMKEQVWESLLPLVFHLHDQKQNVAKAAQEALYFAGWFLKWRKLRELALTAEPWDISKCLLERKRKKTKDFLHQTEVYLQSPQEMLRRDAVRFMGLIGQHVDEPRTTEYIRQALEGPRQDASPLVSSSVTEALLMLEQRRQRSRLSLQWLLPRAWRRRRSTPSRDLQKPREDQ